MTKSLYVGNLPWSATEDDVRDLFAPYGEVTSVKLVSDRETGRARGFGFVEMASEGVQAAVEALDNFSSHVSGIIAGDGYASHGRFKGIA